MGKVLSPLRVVLADQDAAGARGGSDVCESVPTWSPGERIMVTYESLNHLDVLIRRAAISIHPFRPNSLSSRLVGILGHEPVFPGRLRDGIDVVHRYK